MAAKDRAIRSSEKRAMQMIADVARQVGWGQGPELALTVAQMLALASTQQPELEGVRSLLFDRTIELPQSTWADMVEHHMKTDNRLHAIHTNINYPFGVIDKIRRELIGLDTVRQSEPISATLIQAVLDLAAGRAAEMPSLSRTAQLLIADSLAIRPGERVLCADIGAAGLALFLATERRARVSLEIGNQQSAKLFAWLALAGGAEMDVWVLHSEGNVPLLITQEGQNLSSSFTDFEAVVLYPPFGMGQPRELLDDNLRQAGLSSGSSLETTHVMRAATMGQRAACVMPGSYLFRTTKAEQVLKETAIVQYGLDSVIALPREALGRHTAISASLLIFRSDPERPRDGSILMVDARVAAERDTTWHLAAAGAVRKREEGPISTLVSLQDIAAQDFNLAVDRYVLDPQARHARDVLAAAETRLEDVAELHRPQSLPTGAAGRAQASDDAGPFSTGTGERLLEVGVADIDEAGVVRQPHKEVAPTPEVVQRSRKARLEVGDILLVTKGSTGRVGFVREVPDNEAWLASQSFVVARVRRGSPVSDPHVLFRFLSSNVGQAALRSLTVGTSISNLQMADVRRLPVLVPSKVVQADVVDEVRRAFDVQDRIDELRKDAVARLRHVWPDGQASQATETRRGSA